MTDARASALGPVYFTVEDVAEMLRVSTKTVTRWAAADPTLPVLRIGNVTRFPAARLDRWLRNRESGPGRARRSRKLVLSAPQRPDPKGGGGLAGGPLGQPVGHPGAKTTPDSTAGYPPGVPLSGAETSLYDRPRRSGRPSRSRPPAVPGGTGDGASAEAGPKPETRP